MITRDVSISDPQYEVENLRYLTVQSSYLKGRGDITVFVPPCVENHKDIPIVILLHGVYSSHWAWTRHMNVHNVTLQMIERGALEPMLLVMPSDGLKGGGTGYAKQEQFDYEKWIVEDVIEAVESTISQVSKKSKRFISGLSMGGFGALRIGSKYTTVFDGFSGHSSVMNLKDLQLFINDGPQKTHFETENELSVFQTILKNKEHIAPFRFDCGTDDELITSNRNVHQLLQKSSIKHIYEEFSGGHTGIYWQKHIQKSLLFFNTIATL